MLCAFLRTKLIASITDFFPSFFSATTWAHNPGLTNKLNMDSVMQGQNTPCTHASNHNNHVHGSETESCHQTHATVWILTMTLAAAQLSMFHICCGLGFEYSQRFCELTNVLSMNSFLLKSALIVFMHEVLGIELHVC